MKNLTYIYKSLILNGVIIILLYSSCKKVDEHTTFVDEQPAFATSISNTDINVPSLKIFGWTYPKLVAIGDTVTLIGRFFLDKPGLKLQIGNIVAPLVFKQKTPAGLSAGAQPYDVIKYVVTRDMGIGPNIPVKLTANNITINGPFITIQAFAAVSGKTDTTLWVDKIVTWLPANVSQYQNANLALVNSSCVDAAGDLYFTNIFGVFSIKNGKVETVIKAGDTFTENGASFSIRFIAGSVTSFDGNMLSFSASVKENNTDTLNHYVFRLCKLPIGSSNIITLNRTLVKKGIGVITENPSPYEGTQGKVKLVAMNLKTDINQNLYFVNEFSPEAPGADNDGWYSGINTGVTQFSLHSLSNICQINASGQLTSLFYQQGPFGTNDYTPPGYRVDYTLDYLISLDGKLAVVNADFSNGTTAGFTLYGLPEDAPLASVPPFPTIKFLLANGASQNEPVIFVYDNTYTIFLEGILSNGNLLSVTASNGYGSLAAINLQNQTGYLYAGTEAGLYSPPPEQNKTTGKAKYVLFDYNNTYFRGVDQRGSVYYSFGGGPNNSDYTKGVSFYKLYSKKK